MFNSHSLTDCKIVSVEWPERKSDCWLEIILLSFKKTSIWLCIYFLESFLRLILPRSVYNYHSQFSVTGLADWSNFRENNSI